MRSIANSKEEMRVRREKGEGQSYNIENKMSNRCIPLSYILLVQQKFAMQLTCS